MIFQRQKENETFSKPHFRLNLTYSWQVYPYKNHCIQKGILPKNNIFAFYYVIIADLSSQYLMGIRFIFQL